ncbi:DUF262 domain-containing protein [Alcaligenes faecalis]|uniref:DUF262 domain-containing protein n=1 Tax=Alcaligenes faecalis TaxID=511 RepID=UPI00365F7D8E
MSYIETFPMQHSTIIRLYSERDVIDIDPDYQRAGGVWTLEKKQLLIDSILNSYDIPKIYLHALTREQRKSSKFSYAVIDGKQRLETIWQFMDGLFTLSSDFEYQADSSISLNSLGYSDLAASFPKLKIYFDSFVLPIICVETDDIELIEDMFSRLNEAVPLNAAEKRNAIGGDLVAAIRDIAAHPLFQSKVSFSNRRFQHREVAARLLLIEQNMATQGKISDTKKVYLDALARNYKRGKNREVQNLKAEVIHTLENMDNLFASGDELLRAQGNMALYYLLFKSAENSKKSLTRDKLLKFRDAVKQNRLQAEKEYESADFDMLEYDRLSQQGTNDASNLRERLRIAGEFLKIPPITI